MQVIHATGSQYMELLLKTIPGIQLLPEVFFLEDLYQTVEEAYADGSDQLVLIVAPTLQGQQDLISVLSSLRPFPSLRIVFLAGLSLPETILHLHNLGIYDIIYGDVDNHTLTEYLYKPRNYQQAVNEFNKYCQPTSPLPQHLMVVNDAPPTYPKEQVRIIKQQIVAFWSGKPGTGKTLLAVNLAIALAQEGIKVALVDGDLHSLNVSSHLNLYQHDKCLAKALKATDSKEINANLIQHPQWPTLHILSASENCRPEAYQNITKEGFTDLLEALKENFEIIIIDTASDPQMVSTFTALQRSNSIYLVSNLDFGQVHTTKSYLNLLRRLNFKMDKFTMIINSYYPEGKITPKMLEEMLNLAETHRVPLVHQEALESIFQSKPLITVDSPQLQDFHLAIKAMADQLYPVSHRPQPTGLLGKLLRVGRRTKWVG